MSTTKSCYQCKHLEWVDTGSEYGTDCGFCCNRKDYKSDWHEDRHLAMLESEAYLKKGKSCCDPKK